MMPHHQQRKQAPSTRRGGKQPKATAKGVLKQKAPPLPPNGEMKKEATSLPSGVIAPPMSAAATAPPPPKFAYSAKRASFSHRTIKKHLTVKFFTDDVHAPSSFSTLWHAELRAPFADLRSALSAEEFCFFTMDPMDSKEFSALDAAEDFYVLARAKFWTIRANKLPKGHTHEGSFPTRNLTPTNEVASMLELLKPRNEGCVYITDVNLKHRNYFGGQGYGGGLVQKIIDEFGPNQERFVVQPYPPQWRGKAVNTPKNIKAYNADKKKVRDVWVGWGFSRVVGTAYFERGGARTAQRSLK